ncbi:MAG: hypothetical protein ABI444_11505 [Candidatus Kapaibacterium sp.]|jgi:hypothetical protein
MENQPIMPPPPPPPAAVVTGAVPGRGLSIAAMVLGILALCGSWIPFLGVLMFLPAGLAVILGGIGLFQANKVSAPKGFAITGLVTGVIAMILAVVVTVGVSKYVVDHGNKFGINVDSIMREARKKSSQTTTTTTTTTDTLKY